MITLREYIDKLLTKDKKFTFVIHGVTFNFKVHKTLILCTCSKGNSKVIDNKLFTNVGQVNDIGWYIVGVVNNVGYDNEREDTPNIDCNFACDKLMELISDDITTTG